MPKRKNKSVLATSRKNSRDGNLEPVGSAQDSMDTSVKTIPGSRRSGRQRVFNTRFKDMEVLITPKRQAGKTTQRPAIGKEIAGTPNKTTTKSKAKIASPASEKTKSSGTTNQNKQTAGKTTLKVMQNEINMAPSPIDPEGNPEFGRIEMKTARKTSRGQPKKVMAELGGGSTDGNPSSVGRKRKPSHGLWLNKPKRHKILATEHSEGSDGKVDAATDADGHQPESCDDQTETKKNLKAGKHIESLEEAPKKLSTVTSIDVKGSDNTKKTEVNVKLELEPSSEKGQKISKPVSEEETKTQSSPPDSAAPKLQFLRYVFSKPDQKESKTRDFQSTNGQETRPTDDTKPTRSKAEEQTVYSKSATGNKKDDNSSDHNQLKQASPVKNLVSKINVALSGIETSSTAKPFALKHVMVNIATVPGTIHEDDKHQVEPQCQKAESVPLAAQKNVDLSPSGKVLVDMDTGEHKYLLSGVHDVTGVSGEQSKDANVSGEQSKDANVSGAQSKDANVSGEQCMDAGVSVEKANDVDVSVEKANDVDVSGEKSKDADVSVEKSTKDSNAVSPTKESVSDQKEPAKVMEMEIVSLLNLFMTEVDRKKHSDSDHHPETDISSKGRTADPIDKDVAISSESPGDSVSNNISPVAIIDLGQQHGSRGRQQETLTNQDIINANNNQESVSSTVVKQEGNMEYIRAGGIRSREQTAAEISFSDKKTPAAIFDITSGYSSKQAQKHYVVKSCKNKVMTEREGEPGCSRCGLRKDVETQNKSKHICRPPVDDLLRKSNDGIFCCTKCDYRTDKKINWYKHKIKHRERRYQCTKCDYKASTSSNLKRHLMSHDDIRNFGCKICWATFPQKIHLQRHIKYKHQPHNVQCSYCDYVCADVQPDLVVHMKRKHPELCSLDKDGNPIKRGEGALDVFMRYKCEHCSLYAVSRKDLQQHLKFHKKGSELKFFCELCSFVTECESRLKRHMLTHTKEKPYGCSMCNYRGSLPEHVKRHLKTKHKVEVNYSKRKVNKLISEVSNSPSDQSLLLDNDIRAKKPTLSDTRNSEKHFACNFCTMKFSKLISLFKHVHVQHSQMLPPDSNYSCVVCDYTTTHYKRLLLHMRKMHSTTNCMNTPQKQVFVCMSCSYSTPYRLFLHAHLKKEHNMQIMTDKYMMDMSRHSSTMVQTSDESDAKKPGSIIKHSGTSGEQANPNPSKMVLLQLTPDGPMTPVVINMGDSEPSGSTCLMNGGDPVEEYSIMESGMTEAGNALDMECQVIFDDDLKQVLQDTPVTTATVTTATHGTDSVVSVRDITEIIQEIITETTPSTGDESSIETSTAHEQTEPNAGDNTTVSAVGQDGTDCGEEDSEQVVHLSSGDYVEINGQIYKIEMEEECEAKNND